METHDPSLCELGTGLLFLASGLSACFAGAVYLLLT